MVKKSPKSYFWGTYWQNRAGRSKKTPHCLTRGDGAMLRYSILPQQGGSVVGAAQQIVCRYVKNIRQLGNVGCCRFAAVCLPITYYRLAGMQHFCQLCLAQLVLLAEFLQSCCKNFHTNSILNILSKILDIQYIER